MWQAIFERKINEVSKLTHVFEDNVIALITQCEDLGLHAETCGDYVYIHGKALVGYSRCDVENVVEVIHA